MKEPTSALDEASMQQVEKSLLEMLPPQKTRPSIVRFLPVPTMQTSC